MKKNEFITFCTCGCRNGVALKFDNEDDKLSIQLVSDVFYSIQNKSKMSFREKFKRIWCIIRGKEYCYFDILISKDELVAFKEFVSNL